MINTIHDLKDPNDDQGRTYREVNNAKQHKFKVGQLVEFRHGARLFVYRQTRDCGGTPLYVLTAHTTYHPNLNPNHTLLYGYSEEGLVEVKHV